MRLPLLLALLAAASAGADARVDILSKGLSSKDSRLRIDTCLKLGSLKTADAVPPMCGGLRDPEPVVRQACAKGLELTGEISALGCLRSANNDKDGNVRVAVGHALETLSAPAKLVLFDLDDATGRLSEDDKKLFFELAGKKVVDHGYAVLPEGSDRKHVRAWLLKVKVTPKGDSGLRFDVLGLTLPGQEIKGNVGVGAAAKGNVKPALLIKTIAPNLIDQAADEFEWK